ncbi:MAG: MOSC domain-containing protein [Gemmatimonadota bacterium]|nr:MOSC domain-containing protein [Gemmatimonadota bacterium]
MIHLPQGRLEDIWLKRAHRGKMDRVEQAELVSGKGLVGNVDQSRRRQVTLLDREVWQQVTGTLGASIDPSARRANLLVSGLSLARTRGRILRIGDTRLAIGGELTPCNVMDEVLPGLQARLKPDWRGGVFAQVLDGGAIRVGQSIEWDVELDLFSALVPAS